MGFGVISALQPSSPADVTPPSDVFLLAVSSSSSSIDLTASGGADAGSGFLEFVFERSLNGTSGWTEIARQSETTFADTGRTASTEYFYRLSASDVAGNSTGYATAHATTSALDDMVYETQSLVTGIDDGVSFFDNHGGNSATWMSDETRSFVRINWAAGGNAGIQWINSKSENATKRRVYWRYSIRRSASANTKQTKFFGRGYSASPSVYSNCTWGCNAGGYNGVKQCLSYSDKSTGGDIDVQFNLGDYPTLTGGSAYSRTPHPTEIVDIATNDHIDGTWDTHEMVWEQNEDGTPNGSVKKRVNGVIVLDLENMWNCREGGQGCDKITLGDYANVGGVVEDYCDFRVSFDLPSWAI